MGNTSLIGHGNVYKYICIPERAGNIMTLTHGTLIILIVFKTPSRVRIYHTLSRLHTPGYMYMVMLTRS